MSSAEEFVSQLAYQFDATQRRVEAMKETLRAAARDAVGRAVPADDNEYWLTMLRAVRAALQSYSNVEDWLRHEALLQLYIESVSHATRQRRHRFMWQVIAGMLGAAVVVLLLLRVAS